MYNGHHFLHKPVAIKKNESLKWSNFNLKTPLPPIIFPSSNFLAKVGIDTIAKIVLHHHRLLQKSSIAHMYPTDESHFLEGVSKASHFMIEALGGEKVYTFSYGPPALCRTHAPFVIDDEARAVWLMAYKQTLHDLYFPKALIKEFWNWIEPFSLRMINKQSHSTPAKRFLYEDMKKEFGIV
ncbi:globin domain-containing protein [Sulfurospirillum sp.]|uniref:globin domain-containing protein n=1 Tax=Sulfurospirillum sp. TaxID=2053622 RepID=UPI002FDD236A